jgi:hypothetical protein
MTYCSACHSPIASGERFCIRCGADIPGFTMPAAPRKLGHSMLFWIAVTAGPLLMFLYTAGKINRSHARITNCLTQLKGSADRKAFLAALDAISTPQAFIARCGSPQHVLRTNDRAILSYPLVNHFGRIGTERVIIQGEEPKLYFRRVLGAVAVVDSIEDGLAMIGCELPGRAQ